MKKLLIIVLFFTVLLQSGGLMLIYMFQQQNVRLTMQEKMRERSASFERMQMAIEKFISCKINDHELRINGKLYDIDQITIKENVVDLIVVNDSFEEKIIAKIKALFNGNQNSNGDLPKMLMKLFAFEYIGSSNPCLMQSLISRQFAFAFPQNEYSSFNADILSPPPNIG